MPRFTRPNVQTGEGSISESCLPMRGSTHPAFVEMRFLWAGPHETDPRLRAVTLPKGFALKETSSDEWFEVKDAYGYPRASVKRSTILGPEPAIVPLKKYAAGCEKVRTGFRMTVLEWNRPIVRGAVFKTEGEAHQRSVEWLNEYKPGWESYTSGINFSGKPPMWHFFE